MIQPEHKSTYDYAIKKANEIFHQFFPLFFNDDMERYSGEVFLDKLLECFEIGLDERSFSTKSFCGMLILDKFENTILINKTHHKNRKRFTKAHELGHFFLHSHINKEFIDHYGFDHSDDLCEKQANVFASELLMPNNLIVFFLSEKFNLFKISKLSGASPESVFWRLVRYLMDNGFNNKCAKDIVDDYRDSSRLNDQLSSYIFSVFQEIHSAGKYIASAGDDFF